MRRKLVYVPLAYAIGLTLAVTACQVEMEPEAPDYVEEGWQLLAERQYRAAIGQFSEGTAVLPEYADGWNGLGWAYGKLSIADTSVVNFDIGGGLSDPTIIGVEILAGRSFSNLALGEFSDAVADAKKALSRAPIWVFRRDPTLSYRHLVHTVATGFFGLAEFDSCLVWVQRLDNTFTVDVTSLSGRSKLAAKLEALKDIL
ncbi:MAG: hypothetical protein ACETWG_03510 [Candidatus Neomarinimicrobiota bacterium]